MQVSVGHRFPGRLRPGRPAAAFTLIELLVVVAVIAILAGLLLPALASAKARGQGMACLNNARQLSLAWTMYADDFRQVLPFNYGSAEIRQKVADGVLENWNSSIMSWELDPDNTNTVRVTEGGIGPFTSRSAAVYHCPSDHAVSDIQAGAGWSARVRSYSMNAMVGDAGEFSRAGVNLNNPHYRQFFKLTHIPEPAQIFVFTEEHADSINDGYFINKFYSRTWMDLPASWHRGSANLTFADGHAEAHKWHFPSTQPPPRAGAAHLPFSVPLPERGDYDWLMARTSVDTN
jgi:prepilin-type N-terminal cleavage/methylation domain-containing protein/prepilin-type processing-associated H-X9-DG protein